MKLLVLKNLAHQPCCERAGKGKVKLEINEKSNLGKQMDLYSSHQGSAEKKSTQPIITKLYE